MKTVTVDYWVDDATWERSEKLAAQMTKKYGREVTPESAFRTMMKFEFYNVIEGCFEDMEKVTDPNRKLDAERLAFVVSNLERQAREAREANEARMANAKKNA